jgi:uncharacterized protein YbjT (DUF2867 family)
MDFSDKTILVTGATGHQGGAVAKCLLEDGWKVRALVRDHDKPATLGLAEQGVELVQGDLTDRASLDPALRGVYGVYSVQTFREVGAEGEFRQGANLADAAADADVDHFVYSSVIGADRAGGLVHTQAKHLLEAYLREKGLPVTIWRPATFMENYLRMRDDIQAGRFASRVPPDYFAQMIAVDDIGRFVALSFRERDRFLGSVTEIAGDEMLISEVAETFARALAHPVVYEQLPPPPGAPEPRPRDLSDTPPRRADIPALKTLMPDLVSLEEWIVKTGWTD